MMRVAAILLVVAGSCLFCAGLIGGGFGLWSLVSGAGWPADLPRPAWLAGAVLAGPLLAVVGREAIKRTSIR